MAEAVAESTKEFSAETKDLAEKSVPILRDAFEKQVKEDMPKYQEALDRESKILAENLEKELTEKVQKHFDDTSAKCQAILREEFPDLQDPDLLDKMVASVADILERLGEEYYSDKVKTQVEEISKKWDQIGMVGKPGDGDETLNKQFVASLMYLAAMKIDKESVE